jgi:hypothetical protein
MAISDPYGIVYTNTGSVSISGGTTAVSISGGGGGGGSVSNYPSYYPGTSTSWPAGSWPIYAQVTAKEQVLNDTAVMDALIARMITQVDPDRDLVVCLDSDCTPEVIGEITMRLQERGIRATVIAGARAGYGCSMSTVVRPEDKRIDILARIGELWEQRPDLPLTELFSFFCGQDMTDEQFAAAVEVHFKKLTEG